MTRILESVSPGLMKRMEEEKATLTFNRVGFDDKDIIRRHAVPKDEATVWRPAFVHDVDKILHCPYYSRYADKTQAFSFYKNDDISRRSLHVQLVSRIARTIRTMRSVFSSDSISPLCSTTDPNRRSNAQRAMRTTSSSGMR